jgi:hypothetical protein
MKGLDTNSGNISDFFPWFVNAGIIPGRKDQFSQASAAGFCGNFTGNVESEFCAACGRATYQASTGDATAAIEESEHDY